MKKIAIVTGASSGIGKEYFLSLLTRKEQLDEIWVVARSEDKLNALAAQTKIPLRVFALDLSLTQSARTLENALKEEELCIQYLICASGFGRFCAVADDEMQTLENMIDLNCRAILSITKACVPFMAKGGAMILVSSISALQPVPYISTYAATKAFVLSYGRALDKELRKLRGARVLCVCPFWTKTAFFNRAMARDTVVKKYAVMYEPKQIVARTWKDLKHKKRDVSVCGAYTKGQALLVKLLPHRAVMSIWLRQQKLK